MYGVPRLELAHHYATHPGLLLAELLLAELLIG
jgi:hypothetical protein